METSRKHELQKTWVWSRCCLDHITLITHKIMSTTNYITVVLHQSAISSTYQTEVSIQSCAARRTYLHVALAVSS